MDIGPLAAVTVFSCGVFFTLADFTRKKAAGLCSPAMLTAIVFTGVAPLYWVLTILTNGWVLAPGYWLPGLGNALANVLANICFIYSVAVSPLSKTIPLLSLTPALTAFAGALFLHETLSLQQWGGIACVVSGILLLYAPGGNVLRLREIIANLRQEAGARTMALTALFWTIAPVLDRVALRHTTVALDGAIHFTAGACMLWLWIYSRRKFEPPQKHSWRIIGALILCYALAMGTQMLALKLVYVGAIESVKRVMAQISALVLGRVAFSEPLTLNKVFSAGLMCCGVPMIIL